MPKHSFFDGKIQKHYTQKNSSLILPMKKSHIFVATIAITILLMTGCSKAGNDNSSSTSTKSRAQIPYSTTFKTKTPKPIKEQSATALITAKLGGKIELKDEKGVAISFFVQPGGLEKDTTITISPLAEVPIEDYTASINNGVLIEPEGLQFIKPAILTFDFDPQDPATSGGMGSSKINTLPEKASVIHVDSVAGRVSNTYATRSKFGSKLLVKVKSLSSFLPGDLGGDAGDQMQANDMQDAAAGSDGTCSDQFWSAAVAEAEAAQFAGNGDISEGVWEVLKECVKKEVDKLEKMCQEDPLKLRRKYFLTVIQLAQQFDEEQATRADKLMHDCNRNYEIKAQQPISVSEGVSNYQINANLCGYIDDPDWTGKEVVDYVLSVAHQNYGGNIKFTLPWNGGPFIMTTGGSVTATGPGVNLTIPIPESEGFAVNFDGDRTVEIFYQAYGSDIVKAPITMKDNNKCETSNVELNQLGM